MASATRELLAAPAEVWAFLAEPHHLADWWPGIVAVEPDRRGFAPGARWRVVRRGPRGLLRGPGGSFLGPARSETLVIAELVPESRWAWSLHREHRAARVGGPVAVTVELSRLAPARTQLRVEVASRGLRSSDRLTARAAADRLHALLQTAAEL
jgi:uncharacterized protein YndB with AHSA1/START domain